MSRPVQLTEAGGAAPGFDEPFELLGACHERIERTLALLARLRDHVAAHGADPQARQAAQDVLRYFDLAAPQHHLDEERHVLPALRASGDATLQALADRLAADHGAMAQTWAAARPALAALAQGDAAAFQVGEPALHAFRALHAEHLSAEEAVAFPQARGRLDAGAVVAMGADMRARRGA